VFATFQDVKASEFLRNADIVAAAWAELRREHADAGTVAQFVDLVEHIDNVEPQGDRLVARYYRSPATLLGIPAQRHA